MTEPVCSRVSGDVEHRTPEFTPKNVPDPLNLCRNCVCPVNGYRIDLHRDGQMIECDTGLCQSLFDTATAPRTRLAYDQWLAADVFRKNLSCPCKRMAWCNDQCQLVFGDCPGAEFLGSWHFADKVDVGCARFDRHTLDLLRQHGNADVSDTRFLKADTYLLVEGCKNHVVPTPPFRI